MRHSVPERYFWTRDTMDFQTNVIEKGSYEGKTFGLIIINRRLTHEHQL